MQPVHHQIHVQVQRVYARLAVLHPVGTVLNLATQGSRRILSVIQRTPHATLQYHLSACTNLVFVLQERIGNIGDNLVQIRNREAHLHIHLHTFAVGRALYPAIGIEGQVVHHQRSPFQRNAVVVVAKGHLSRQRQTHVVGKRILRTLKEQRFRLRLYIKLRSPLYQGAVRSKEKLFNLTENILSHIPEGKLRIRNLDPFYLDGRELGILLGGRVGFGLHNLPVPFTQFINKGTNHGALDGNFAQGDLAPEQVIEGAERNDTLLECDKGILTGNQRPAFGENRIRRNARNQHPVRKRHPDMREGFKQRKFDTFTAQFTIYGLVHIRYNQGSELLRTQHRPFKNRKTQQESSH